MWSGFTTRTCLTMIGQTMRIDVSESNVPRLHLAGTLAIVFVLTLTLGAFFRGAVWSITGFPWSA